jgi:predicted RNase H-like HicB family nuclease
MKSVIQFTITGDKSGYTAEGVNVPVVTQGSTFEDLQVNIRDAVDLLFEKETPETLGFIKSATIFTNYEMPLAYGAAA